MPMMIFELDHYGYLRLMASNIAGIEWPGKPVILTYKQEQRVKRLLEGSR